MATSTYSIGTTAKTIADRALPGGASTLICPSTNTDTVWADSTQVAAAVGIPITPGSTQPWPGDQALYAWSATNGQQLLVAPGVDQGTNAGAIATALLAQGLPAAIAADISVSGAPPIDQPAVLLMWSQRVPSGAPPLGTVLIDVTRYNFIEAWVTELATTAPPTSWRHLTLNWYSDLAGTDRIHGHHYYYFAAGGMQGVKLPVPGGAVALKLTNTSTATTNDATLTYRVYGSTRVGAASSWNGNLAGSSGYVPSSESYGLSGFFLQARAAAIPPTIYSDYPDIYDGPAVLNLRAVSVTGQVQCDLIDVVDQQAFAQVVLNASANPQAGSLQFIMPRRPIWLRISVSGGASNVVSAIVMTPW